jgi:hypothetical protein
MIMIRTVNPLQTRRVAKAMKPRNPVLAALKNSQGAKGAGAHRKKRGALRRAEKMAVAQVLAGSDF